MIDWYHDSSTFFYLIHTLVVLDYSTIFIDIIVLDCSTIFIHTIVLGYSTIFIHIIFKNILEICSNFNTHSSLMQISVTPSIARNSSNLGLRNAFVNMFAI